MRISISFGKTSIKDVIKKYKGISENIDELADTIIEDLKKVGLKEISSSLGNSQYITSEPLSIVDEKRAIGIRGAQAIYDEYGTGTMGAMNPHPEKPSGLNAYNSGATIRMNTKGRSVKKNDGLGGSIAPNTLYWTFRLNGEKIYTQGRPAGMHVFKAKKEIRENMQSIIKKRVGEYLSKR